MHVPLSIDAFSSSPSVGNDETLPDDSSSSVVSNNLLIFSCVFYICKYI